MKHLYMQYVTKNSLYAFTSTIVSESKEEENDNGERLHQKIGQGDHGSIDKV